MSTYEHAFSWQPSRNDVRTSSVSLSGKHPSLIQVDERFFESIWHRSCVEPCGQASGYSPPGHAKLMVVECSDMTWGSLNKKKAGCASCVDRLEVFQAAQRPAAQFS